MKIDTYTKILLTVAVLFLGVIAFDSLPSDIQEEILDRRLRGDQSIVPLGNPSNREFLHRQGYSVRHCRWDIGPPHSLKCSYFRDGDDSIYSDRVIYPK